MQSPIDFLYDATDRDTGAFGPHWCGPERFARGEDTLIARYERESEDGHDVEVWCAAYPARFYEVRALAATSSVGKMMPAFTLYTGSGAHKLVAQLAHEIITGMLGCRPTEAP